MLRRSHQIEDGEGKDPDEVDEVPEEAADFDAIGEVLGVFAHHFAVEDKEVEQDERSGDDVQAMQAREGEVDGVVGVQLRRVIGEEGDVLGLDDDLGSVTVAMACIGSVGIGFSATMLTGLRISRRRMLAFDVETEGVLLEGGGFRRIAGGAAFAIAVLLIEGVDLFVAVLDVVILHSSPR